MTIRTFAVVLVVCSVACTPTLTPVSERQGTALTGQAFPARVSWLLDSSGSLLIPTDPSDARCPAGCGSAGNPCPAICPDRADLLTAGVRAFEAELPTSIQQSLTFYPSDPYCGPPTSIRHDLTGAQVVDRVGRMVPVGGTPTGSALRFVQESAFPDAGQGEHFVVLITDGLPNCNQAHPSNLCALYGPDAGQVDQEVLASAQRACNCSTSTCTPASLCSAGCTDDLGTVNASRELAAAGMSLMVIGLGPDIAVAKAYLASLEIAVAPICPQGADAGCDRLFLTSTEAGFSAPAQRLSRAVKESERCGWVLPREVIAADLSVEISGTLVDPSEWSLRAQGTRVVIFGPPCERLLNGSETPTFTWLPATR